jgi:hypothetical protein
MRRLLTGYDVSFNRRHRRHGQLFQNRYKSILCQGEIPTSDFEQSVYDTQDLEDSLGVDDYSSLL